MSAAPTPPVGMQTKARPAARWIVVAIVLIIVGPGGCTAFAAVRVIGAVRGADDYGRYSLPARGDQVRFTKPVTDGALMAVTHGTGSPPQLSDIRLLDPNGARVPLAALESSRVFTYTNGGNRARLAEVARFTIHTPGTYELSALPASSGDQSEIWVGHHIDVATVGIGALLGLVVFIAGVAMLITVLVRRRRFRRSAQPPSGWGTPGAGYPASPGGYPPPPGYGAPPPPGYGAPPPPPPPPPPAPAPGQWGASPPPAPGWGEPGAEPPSGTAPPPPPPA